MGMGLRLAAFGRRSSAKMMGYNLKNDRNEKSMSKIGKWPGLRSLALKDEIL